MSEITSFTKEWRELRIHKTREITMGVKVVLEKDDESHLVVYLDGLKDVPSIIQYGNENQILIYANTPDNYDGTEEDKKRKINEVISEAEKIYKEIYAGQIIDLQNAINEHEAITEKIYSITRRMRG